jgi:hypothetical protein|tara:strand:- start:52 stop:192 length:141 start_codon:yes stop_codon:yes gene_type:complete
VSCNASAIAFYHNYGFKVIGETLLQVGSDPQRDWLLSLKMQGQRAA